LIDLFQKVVGSQGKALSRRPQTAKLSGHRKSSSFCFFFSSLKEKKKNFIFAVGLFCEFARLQSVFIE
jgi:hypothetical protein